MGKQAQSTGPDSTTVVQSYQMVLTICQPGLANFQTTKINTFSLLFKYTATGQCFK